MMARKLEWQIFPQGFKLIGILDRSTLVAFWNQKQNLITEQKVMTIDLTQLVHADSSGIAMLLLLLHNLHTTKKIECRLVGVNQQLHHLITLYNLQTILSPCLKDAL